MLIFALLDILQQYTDEAHRLSRHQPGELPERAYGITADRKTVRRSLPDLMDAGCALECREASRCSRGNESETLQADCSAAPLPTANCGC